VTVFLRPEIGEDGSLILRSPTASFGSDGAYLIVAEPDRTTGWAKRIPLVEEFVVSADEDGALRTDHALALWKIPALQLRYRITTI